MMVNKWMIIGMMLSLSIGSVFAADSVETGKNSIERRVPENGYGIVPMPYEVKARAGNPFVITKETVLVGRGAEAEKCAVYLQQRLRKSCGLNLKTATAGDMVKEGWTLSREFKHASVWVNLETREANIKWH